MADKKQKPTKKNRRKLFDVVDKIGNGVKKYGPVAAAFVAGWFGFRNKKK